MAYDIGPKIGIEGEAEYKRQINDINTGLKTLGSEMKVVTSEFLGQEKSVESLSKQNDVLQRTSYSLTEKLEAQKKMLQEAADAYGEADSRTQRWQQIVNNTTAELNKNNAQISKNEKEIAELGEETKKTGDEMDDAGKKSSTFGDMLKANLASDAIIGGIKAIGGAVKELASALGGVIKESVAGFADNEQLIGGIETLFGDAGKAVADNANKAFQSAGLSANEYMETVTSFSASLISSLGGDTAKAAEYADMAITDMADNANKMGSDISSIQNAYQGFAKGQYAMLDNLKLGYGGTKTEMERLVADAEKLDDAFEASRDENGKLALSYADVVEAIHIVQDNMGITGATAKEASETISGSIGALKSSWTNLISALGNPSADISQLSSLVISSAKTVINNILPVVENVVSVIPEVLASIAGAIAENAPMLLDTASQLIATIWESVKTVIDELLPDLMAKGTEILMNVIQGIVEALPEILNTATEMISTLATGIANALPELIPALVNTVIAIADGLVDNMPMLIEAALQLILGLAEGLIKALPELIKNVPRIIIELVKALIQEIPRVWEVGVEIVKGIWEGIKSMADWLWKQVSGFFSNLIDGVKDSLGIHSPSKVFAGIGRNMALGLGEGWDETIAGITSGMQASIPVSVSSAGGTADAPGGAFGAREVVINLTSKLDGLTLARNQYRYNMAEIARHGGSLVGGMA